MLLKIKTTDGASFSIDIPADKTVGELLAEVSGKLDVKAECIRLVTRDTYLYNHALKLSEYKLFHGQTLFLLKRNPCPAQISSNLSERIETPTAIEACLALLQEEEYSGQEADTKKMLLHLLTKLSQKYSEMSQELVVCADLLSRPNNTSFPAHWKDLAAFRRKAFSVSEASSVVSSILYGSTLATSAAIAQGQPLRQFLLPSSINMSWSKTFDSFGHQSMPNALDHNPIRLDLPPFVDFMTSSFDNNFSHTDFFDKIFDCIQSITHNLNDLPPSMTLDKYFIIPVSMEDILYEITSKITVQAALEILSGSIEKLDDYLYILKRKITELSNQPEYFMMMSLQLPNRWFSLHNQPTQSLSNLLFKLHEATSRYIQAIIFEIGFSAVSSSAGESLLPHQFFLLATFNWLLTIRKELDNNISQSDWDHLLLHTISPIAKALLPHLGMGTTLALLRAILPEPQASSLSSSLSL